MAKFTASQDMLAKLEKAGKIPPNCRRAIIDIKMNNAVTVYFETFAEEELLDSVLDDPNLRLIRNRGGGK